ncbi:MAG: aldo/keto reductase [Solirubrobacterales bacterium]
MPWLGYGTYKAKSEECIEGVKEALKAGYKHIDTASFYGNEESVGIAIKESNIERKDIFLVSKVWNEDQGYDNTLRSFEASIKALNTDYLDLYLIHWPLKISRETWRAMEKIYLEGKVRAIGVSNFNIEHLKYVMNNCEVIPMVNQVEFHPELIQHELINFCKNNKIQMEAWSPLMRGRVLQIPLFKNLSEKYNKTISQIVLRWDLQMGFVTIPKSTNPERIKENTGIFDFELSNEDMLEIEKLNAGLRIGMDPDDIFNDISKIKG